MERACEGARVALVVGADLVAAMRTAIEQEIDLALLVAGHDDRLRPDRLDDVVVRVRAPRSRARHRPRCDTRCSASSASKIAGIACRASRAPGRGGSIRPIATRAAPRSSLHLPLHLSRLARALLRRPAAWAKNNPTDRLNNSTGVWRLQVHFPNQALLAPPLAARTPPRLIAAGFKREFWDGEPQPCRSRPRALRHACAGDREQLDALLPQGLLRTITWPKSGVPQLLLASRPNDGA